MQISPSILSADFANLQAELAAIRSADWAHVDVMDNHFVPNLTLGLPVVESLAKVSPVPLDCHLMIDDPDRWAPGYVEAGAESVTFHVEAAADPRGVARTLRGLGARAGMAIKPNTPWAPYEDLLPDLDMVLVMTVEPGFGGQSFIPEALPKLAAARERIDAAMQRTGRPILLEVDGGVKVDNIEDIARAGADTFVAGSAIFGAADYRATIAQMRAALARAG